MMGSRLLVGALVASLVLAGCAGESSDKAAASSTVPPPASPAAPTDEFGSIAGTVIDEEQQPVVGAIVGLRELSTPTKSDEGGAFVFNDLAPGTYRVDIEKLGFESVARSAEVSAGEVTKVTLTLKAQAILNETVVRMTPYPGFIQCSVNWLYPTNPCGGATGEEKNMFTFEVDKTMKLEEAVFELVWTPSSAGVGEELELDICNYKADSNKGLVCLEAEDDYNVYDEGPSPVVIRIENLPVKDFQIFATGAGAARNQAAYQQSFTIYVTLCYNQPCGEEYSALPKDP